MNNSALVPACHQQLHHVTNLSPSTPRNPTQIWAVDPEAPSKAPTALTSLEQGVQLAAHPAFSPDGKRLAFSGMQDGSLNVWVRNADGSLNQLTHTAAPINSMVPAWTPDGKRIVFESNRAVPPEESTPEDPYDVSAGRVMQQCTCHTFLGYGCCCAMKACMQTNSHSEGKLQLRESRP